MRLKTPLLPSLTDGFAMGMGFTSALVILGAIREVLGSGTLLSNAHLMFGEAARDITIYVLDDLRRVLIGYFATWGFYWPWFIGCT